MIDENFKLLNRKRDTTPQDALEVAKILFTKYSKCSTDDDWSFDKLNQLERKVEILEYRLWCFNYNKS
jgi:hypothetical protein